MPDIKSPEVNKGKSSEDSSPHIKFLHTSHLDEHFESIWKYAQKADVILIENVADKEGKQKLEEIINYGASSKYPETKAQCIAVTESAIRGSNLLKSLAKNAIEYGKEFHFIDSYLGESDEADMQMCQIANLEANTLYDNGDIKGSFESYVEFIKFLASGSRGREDRVTKQIENMMETNRSWWKGKDILVIQGALHTRTYHNLKSRHKDVPMSRTFNGDDFSFVASAVLARKLLFNKPVTETDYKRAYMSEYVIRDALFDSDEASWLTDEEVNKKSDAIVRKLSETDVNEYWDRLINGDVHPKDLGIKLIGD